MAKDTTWHPAIADKAGRGELCSRIQQLTKEINRYRQGGPAEDAHELKRLLKRLDEERAKFHKLYGHKSNDAT